MKSLLVYDLLEAVTLTDVLSSLLFSPSVPGAATVSMTYRKSVSSAPDVPSSVPKETGRRTVLPAQSSDNSHIGILTILYNNIGKDLSRVSMPVALNEPLNLLQRVSEELEYSELLDVANRTDDPYQRMVRPDKIHCDSLWIGDSVQV